MNIKLLALNSLRPSNSTVADAPEAYDDFGLRAHWGETAVTVVATSLALLVVVAVAILMGMA